jgi:HEAT repeat protein
MSRHDEYVQQLSGIEHATERVAFLRRHSGLPGPRGNLELVQAAADVGDERAFGAWIAAGSGDDPTDEFLVVCGVVGLGRLVAEGRTELVEELHAHASDPRWRVRESVAMALQRVGDADVDLLFEIVGGWLDDRLYVQRAAVAAVAEPRLLKTSQAAAQAVVIVDRVTGNLEAAADRHTDEFRVLRQALAYCWSVVVVADPREGKPRLEQWATSFDPDVRWVVRENLKKTRLIRLDREWVEMLAASLAG